MDKKSSKKSSKLAKETASKKSKTAAKAVAKKVSTKKPAVKKAAVNKLVRARSPVLLSGGNPQIAKADGDAPVQVYIAAMPGWKSEAGRHLDQLIDKTVPKVQKAVRWNTPFYGVEGQGWFLAFHCFTKYIKVTFFKGMSLRPIPPGESKDKNVRYLDIYQNAEIDQELLVSWIKQASELPGWNIQAPR